MKAMAIHFQPVSFPLLLELSALASLALLKAKD